jgi:hypothetical protein
MTMNHSWLVQRLEKPHSFKVAGKDVDNPFSFGGGIKNGGLSEDAMSLLRPIFSFDYMGAAEFEFGAVPKALSKIAKFAEAGTLTTQEIEIPFTEIARSWQHKDTPDLRTGSIKIYVLCNADHDEVEARIRSWAAKDYNDDLKESTRLSAALRQEDEWDARKVGWLELDNGFMFFCDREVFARTAGLFGIEIEL